MPGHNNKRTCELSKSARAGLGHSDEGQDYACSLI